MTAGHNFHRFTGWRLAALICVFLAYTLWFIGPGPFGELTRLEAYQNLQSRGFYSGAEALSAIESLSADARRIKFTALGFDIIYMVLQTWVFEAVIAFGLSVRGLTKTRWRWILLLPICFLLFDFLEDSCLALVMVTSSEIVGSLAGVFTFMKFMFFIPSVCLSLGLGFAATVTLILRKRKGDNA